MIRKGRHAFACDYPFAISVYAALSFTGIVNLQCNFDKSVHRGADTVTCEVVISSIVTAQLLQLLINLCKCK